VQNHLKTVHAIAVCNLCEVAAGLMTEVSVPTTHRWIPMGMEIKYRRKSTTNLRAIACIDLPEWQAKHDLAVPVSVRDEHGVEVVRAVITMRVTAK